MRLKFTKLSNNNRILHFIFYRLFDDERIINYEWPNQKTLSLNFMFLCVIVSTKIFLEYRLLEYLFVSFDLVWQQGS